MIILPAIDLQNGRCVRLRQGRADDATVYSDDPVAMARQWLAQGAAALHVVDLDGAFAGVPKHLTVVQQIVAAMGAVPVELGGGLRTDDDVRRALATGVARVIIGTRALADPVALQRLVQAHGDRIAVGIDARNGLVQVKGWVETSGTRATDLARRAAELGVATIIYTDTATDGMLAGTNVAAMDEMCRTVPTCRVIASGGVSAPEHVRALAALGHANLYGAIVGKALYDGRTTLMELQQSANECGHREHRAKTENTEGCCGWEKDDLTRRIITCALQVHKTLGPGMLESAYQKCLAIEFAAAGLKFEEQRAVDVTCRNEVVEGACRMDFVVEDIVVVELKTATEILPVHEAQILSYLRFTKLHKGLLINFNVRLLKNGIRRFIL
jgi:phosphoribosylformimino-5-aminoimidazole carboxamide ribotide isomerase